MIGEKTALLYVVCVCVYIVYGMRVFMLLLYIKMYMNLGVVCECVSMGQYFVVSF